MNATVDPPTPTEQALTERISELTAPYLLVERSPSWPDAIRFWYGPMHWVDVGKLQFEMLVAGEDVSVRDCPKCGGRGVPYLPGCDWHFGKPEPERPSPARTP